MMTKLEIPDFDKLYSLIDDIYNLSLEKGRLELELKIDEAELNSLVTTDERFFINGKPPSQAYIDNTWKHKGIDGKLLDKRLKLIEFTSLLDKKKMLFSTYKMLIDVYRTESANERTLIV